MSEVGSQQDSVMARQVDILAKQMQQLQEQMKEQMQKLEKRSPEKPSSEKPSSEKLSSEKAAPSDQSCGKPETSEGATPEASAEGLTPSPQGSPIPAPEASIEGNFSWDDRDSMKSEENRAVPRASGDSESIPSSADAAAFRSKRAAGGSESSWSAAEPTASTAPRVPQHERYTHTREHTHNFEVGSMVSGVSTERATDKAKVHRLSPSAFQDMRRVSRRLNCVTTWLRAVHSGHGQDLWRVELESKGMVVVHGPSPAEGAYVLIPPSTTPEEVVQALLQMNLIVRRRTHFDEMNRANKSRVVFKCEPFTVAPLGDERPVLVRTTRFSQGSAQPPPAQSARVEGRSSFASTSDQTDQSTNYQAWGMNDQAYRSTNDQAYQSTNDQTYQSTSERNGGADGSISLDSLAMMAPMLDQKSRSDFADLASVIDG